MERLILRFHKKIDAKGRISIPKMVIRVLNTENYNISLEEDKYVIINKDNNGNKILDSKDRLSLSKKIVDKIGSNEVYMEVYKTFIKLIPIKKGGRGLE